MLFVSKTKLQELSNKIENDPLVKGWIEHIQQYKTDLFKKIKITKKYNKEQKYIFQSQENETLKSYIRDLNQIIRLIEIEWKMEELNNDIIKEIKNIKSDIDNIKDIIKIIFYEINEIKISNRSDPYIELSMIITKILENALKTNFSFFSVIYNLAMNVFSIYEVYSLINEILNMDSNSKYEKNLNEIKNNIDLINKFANLIDKPILYYPTVLLNNINMSYDVPADGSCLFWSVATAYLLPVSNDSDEFAVRFIRLFGIENIKNLSDIKKLLIEYDLENHSNNQSWYNNVIAQNLITNVFRDRVVDYIQSNLDMTTNLGSELTFRNIIQENNGIVNNYLERMRQSSTWGGTPEILAISNILNSNISVNNHASYQPVNQNSTNNINIFYVNGNHYNFTLSNQNLFEQNTNTSTNNVRGGGCLNEEDNDIENNSLLLNIQQLKNNEYHFLDKEAEQKSLKMMKI